MPPAGQASKNPWKWVPSLYFAEGLPYVIVMTVSVIMYKRLGLSNTEIALYTSWFYLPWVIKPFWSPFVDILKTKRSWVVAMELILGAGFAGIALTIPAASYLKFTLAFFWLLAFSSATHDISIDGFYMLGLSEHDQAYFVGIRNTFYRIAMIFGQGVLIILAGFIESHSGLPPVDVFVSAGPGLTSSRIISPGNYRFNSNTGPLKIVSYPDTLKLNTSVISKSEADSLVRAVRKWNSANSFYKGENSVAAESGTGKKEPSWFEKNILSEVEHVLKKYFGPGKTAKKSAVAGNTGVILFHLSKEPPEGKNIVLNFGREYGNKNISLIEGGRFLFNSSNWKKPAAAVIQLDPNLKIAAFTSFDARSGNVKLSWIITFLVLSGIFLALFLYHRFILPRPGSDKSVITNASLPDILKEFFKTFALFFNKEEIWIILAYILFYRFGEAQLAKIAPAFLLDTQEAGGLALTTAQIGVIYGTIGVIALITGGIIGGMAAAKNGAKYWIWWMLVAINLPDLVYVFLSYSQTTNLLIINIAIALEQFGYGFGFTSFMLILIYISEGSHKTSHYALATGFMALGMMFPGALSGWLQSVLGYRHFFIWVCISTIPAFIITKYIKIDPEFGKKTLPG